MTGYEHLRERHLADLAAMAPELMARLTWPAERLAEHRTAELRRLVRVAQEFSPGTAGGWPGCTPTRSTRPPWPSCR